MTLDCDTDVTKWNRLHELRTPPRSSQRRQIDLQQLQAGQKVVKKYRKYARNAEFRRLRTIVPTLASKNDVSKVCVQKLFFRQNNTQVVDHFTEKDT